MHRNALHWFTKKNERSEREIKKTISLSITSKRIKCLGINLPKEAKDLYSENYKILMKKMKDDTNRWMERYTMFLDGKNQYCENDDTTQSNLQIQCNPCWSWSFLMLTIQWQRRQTKSLSSWSLQSPSDFAQWLMIYEHSHPK